MEVVQWVAILCLEYYCPWRVLFSVWVKCKPSRNMMSVTAGRRMFDRPRSVKLVQVVEEEKLGKRFSSRLYAKIFIYICSAWSEGKWNGILYNFIYLFIYCTRTHTQTEYVMDETWCVSANLFVSFFKITWWIFMKFWKVSVHLNLSTNFDLSVLYHHLHNYHHHHHYGTQNLSLGWLKCNILKHYDL